MFSKSYDYDTAIPKPSEISVLDLSKMPIIPYWYELTEIERRACFYWDAYEKARISPYIDIKYRDELFERYTFWRMRLEKN